MGFLDLFRRTQDSSQLLPQSMTVSTLPNWGQLSSLVEGQSVEHLWRTQPYLRTVVTFLARNIAQLGLHTFVRVGETDRRRLRDDPLADLLRQPNPEQTTYELVFGLVADLALYDIAYWAVAESSDRPSGWLIRPIAPSWVIGSGGGSLFAPEWYDVQPPNGTKARLPADQMLVFHGWDPGRPAGGSSPVVALKQILAEQIHAQAYRQQVWTRGGRVGAVLKRPREAPVWSDAARERFAADWKSRWTGDDGPKAGGTPILEDGMELQRLGFSAKEDDFIEAAKLSLQIVASVYHVNPTMIGLLDNANYSNVREFRRSLYGDTLGPIMSMVEDRLNAFLVPRVTSREGVYVEFNIGEKLQGSFEEQAVVLSTATGRPYMTSDEARAKLNLPALGGDAAQLVTPLNVLVGGQASPADAGTQNRTGGQASRGSVQVKERPQETVTEKATQVLLAFFARQGKSVASRAGAGNLDWDSERWDRELAGELAAVNVLIATAAGRATLSALGLDVDVYDEDVTLAWLRANASGVAAGINETTKAQVAQAVEQDEEGDAAAAVTALFAGAMIARAKQAAVTQVTAVSGFATQEAVRQSGVRAVKTWRVRNSNPRKSHQRLDGETVDVGESFSNGARWPGDISLDVDERAGCTCDVEMSLVFD